MRGLSCIQVEYTSKTKPPSIAACILFLNVFGNGFRTRGAVQPPDIDCA